MLTCPAPGSSPVTTLAIALNFYPTDFYCTMLCSISNKLDLM